MPVGLAITFSPDPPERNYYSSLGTSIGPHYLYDYGVKVRSSLTLTVESWGTFVAGKEDEHYQFDRQEFEKAFHCPGAQMAPNEEFECQKADSFGPVVGGEQARWYIIAVDSAGRRYKGEASTSRAKQ